MSNEVTVLGWDLPCTEFEAGILPTTAEVERLLALSRVCVLACCGVEVCNG